MTTSLNLKGKNYFVAGIPPVWGCSINAIDYPITPEQITMLRAAKITALRFYFTDESGKEIYKDYDIKPKNQEDLINLMNCVF